MTYFVQLLGSRADLMVDPVSRLGCKSQVIARPQELSPEADICLAWGVFKFIKPEFLNVPRLGTWGFHESPLPKGRGCAPLHWTVLNHEKQATVSFFKLVERMDTGPLIAQSQFSIEPTDLLEELRAKATVVVHDMIRRDLIPFLRSDLKPTEQQGEPSSYRKRTSEDSRLDPTKSLNELWDQMRVCDNEAYPAWFEIDGKRIVLKRYKG